MNSYFCHDELTASSARFTIRPVLRSVPSEQSDIRARNGWMCCVSACDDFCIWWPPCYCRHRAVSLRLHIVQANVGLRGGSPVGGLNSRGNGGIVGFSCLSGLAPWDTGQIGALILPVRRGGSVCDRSPTFLWRKYTVNDNR